MQHVERAIAVEGRNLDACHTLECCEALPIVARQYPSANGWLQIEPDHRQHLPHRTGTLDHFVIAARTGPQQHHMIAEVGRLPCFGDGLPDIPLNARHHHHRSARFSSDLRCDLQHRPQHAVVVDGKLRRVHTDRHAASAGGNVVAPDRALPRFIELAIGREGQRMSGNGATGGKDVDWGHQNFPSRFWKPVGLPSSGNPSLTQWAVHSTTCPRGTVG